MEQTKTKNEQRMLMDEKDYIDIPAFFRSFLRYARKYALLAVPLIICMSMCLSILTKPYTKKTYVSGGTAMIGVRLSDSVSFDYNLSGLSWDRHSTLAQMEYVLNALLESGYIDQCVKDSMGKKRSEELNGQIGIKSAYSSNLVDIYAVSESKEDAEAIRDAVLSCLPDAVFPAVGFIEMNIQELYTREESSPRAFLTSPKVWALGGVTLGIIGYLGLVFLYTLRRRDVETPQDLLKLTDLPCLGSLPALKKRIRFGKRRGTDEIKDSFVVTEAHRRTFDSFRRTIAAEIRQSRSRVILLTGCGSRKDRSAIAADLEEAWSKLGKKVIVTDLMSEKEPLAEEKVRSSLDQTFKEADLVLIDGPSCDQSANYLVLADCADAVIIVIREGASQPAELREMFQSLQYTNAKPLGYVLTSCRHTVT